MADSDNGGSSWPGLLGQINKTFDLIRDIFGYALPGAVFLTIGVIAKRGGYGGFSLDDVVAAIPAGYTLPAWAAFLAAVAASYAVGNMTAAIAYMPIGVWKWGQWQRHKQFLYSQKTATAEWLKVEANQQKYHSQEELLFPQKPLNDTLEKWLADEKHAYAYQRLRDNPTEVTGDLEELRLRQPKLFYALDRRETLALMSGSMCAALLSGWLVFYVLQLRAGNIFLLGGIFLLIQFATALSHLRRVRRAVREADTISKSHDSEPAKTMPNAVLDLVNALSAFLSKK